MAGGQGAPHTIPKQRTMNQGLGLLTNQLYWHTTPIITPTLRFGFAVYGGGSLIENLFPRFRSIPKKSYCGQALAGIEGLLPNAGDTIRN